MSNFNGTTFEGSSQPVIGVKGRSDDFSNGQTLNFDFGQLKEKLETPKSKLFIRNVVGMCELGFTLDKKFILENSKCYKEKNFAGLIHKRSRSTAFIFGSGKINIVGCKSVEECESEAKEHIAMLKSVYATYAESYLKITAIMPPPPPTLDLFSLKKFNIHNIVASATTMFPISLSDLCNYYSEIEYEPEEFAGATYKMVDLSITVMIFAKGNYVLTGGKTTKDIWEAFERVVKMVTPYKRISKDDSKKTLTQGSGSSNIIIDKKVGKPSHWCSVIAKNNNKFKNEAKLTVIPKNTKKSDTKM